MVDSISILGSTGSIGRQTVEVALRLGIKVKALAAGSNIALMEEQARLLSPDFVSVYDERSAKLLKIALRDTGVKIGSGEEGLIDAAVAEGCDAVVTAMSGSVGLRPTLAAIHKGCRIALANKETLVCAGEIVMEAAREYSAEIIPVDSEHSAIFQCLAGRKRAEVSKIILTASGGPFRNRKRSECAEVTPEEALKHPSWNMGAKITIDSATLMNKGLEFIEAMRLFDAGPGDIDILVHPESVIHSMVELTDGSVIAQLGTPDMALPIQYALTYPERAAGGGERLSLARRGTLSFYEPEYEEFPCLRVAISCAGIGGTAPAILSAANEVAVALFLERKIKYNEIYECVASALDNIEIKTAADLETVIEADLAARAHVTEVFS